MVDVDDFLVDDCNGIYGTVSRIVNTGQKDMVLIFYNPLAGSIGNSVWKAWKGEIQYPFALPKSNYTETTLPGAGLIPGVPRRVIRIIMDEKGESKHLELTRGKKDDILKELHDVRSQLLSAQTEIGNLRAQLRGKDKNVEKLVEKAQEMAKVNNPWDAMNNRFNGGFNNRPSEFDQEE